MTRISEFVLNFLLNATWQILAITMVASLGSRLLKNGPARYRHSLWVAALLLSVALPLRTVIGVAQKTVPSVVAPASVNRTPETAPPPAVAGTGELTMRDRENGSLSVGNLLARRRHSVETTPGLLWTVAVAYALFILYQLIRLVRLWRRKETLRRSVYERELPPEMERIEDLCRTVFGQGRVTLGCSATALLPVTVGFRKPLIVLPEGLYSETRDETLLSVVGHEMAHVARRDFALNLICELVRLPISFHPFTYSIKRQIDRARELACDELVTDLLLAPEAYARSLVRVANASIQPAGQAFMLSIFDADILEERIMKLTQKRRQLGLRVGRAIFVTAFTVLCLSAFTISTFSFDLRAHTTALVLEAVSSQPAATLSKTLAMAVEPIETTQEPNAGQTAAAKPPDSASPERRAQAACDAGRKHAVEAIPMLVSMLGDDSKIEPIRCWESGRWSPALQTFKQYSPGEEAAIALASMGMPAFEPLTNELANSNPSVRRNAAWAIGELTNMFPGKRAGAVPQLISLLSDFDQWVRMAAARALGELRDERAGESLIGALADSQWRVRELAAWALSEMKDERAVTALCNLLLTDVRAEVRRTAAEALGEIKSSKAISSLKQALNDLEPHVRAKAGWAISEIEDNDG